MKNKNAEFEKMRSGKLYNSTEKNILKKHVRALWLCDRYNKSAIWNIPKRNFIIKRLIPNIAPNFFIMTPMHVEYGCNLTIGKDFFSNFNCMFLDVATITIGDSVMLGPNVTLATPMHPLLAQERIIQEYPDGYHDLEYAKPIVIQDGVWIASGATVCGGVTVGKNSIIGAGSVVTHDVPPNTLVAGVPAKVIRTLDEQDKIDVWETYCKNDIPLSARDKAKIHS